MAFVIAWSSCFTASRGVAIGGGGDSTHGSRSSGAELAGLVEGSGDTQSHHGASGIQRRGIRKAHRGYSPETPRLRTSVAAAAVRRRSKRGVAKPVHLRVLHSGSDSQHFIDSNRENHSLRFALVRVNRFLLWMNVVERRRVFRCQHRAVALVLS